MEFSCGYVPDSCPSPRLIPAPESGIISHQLPENPLQLYDLVIVGFRGIQKLTIGRLGRVTLLAGKNGVGKTTVLEAVRVFASRERHTT